MSSVGDLLVEYKEMPKSDSTAPVLTLTERNGFVRQADRFHKRLATEDTSKYKVVHRNDIAFNPYLLWAGAVAQNTIVDEGIISPLYPTFKVRNGHDPRYVAQLLLAPQMVAAYDTIAFGSVPRRRRSSVENFLKLPVPESPSLREQQRIAAILDQASRMQVRRLQVADHLRELIPALFLEAFGEQLDGPASRLDEIAEISSGITKGRKTTEPTSSVPYLAVVNVQAGHLVLDPLKEIGATEAEIERYSLKDGDLVLTEGGDPDKLGRGTVWRCEVPLCLHQNHIFRVRIRPESMVEPDYLSAYLASRTARSYFLRAAKQTTGIASINMTQLRGLPVLVPPLLEQRQFLEQVGAVNRQLESCTQQSAEIDQLWRSLQSRAFSGKL